MPSTLFQDSFKVLAVPPPVIERRIEEEKISERAITMGQRMRTHMLEIAQQTNRLKNIRGIGGIMAADLIANEKVIGWVQGRMEFGPRALGCRSILGDPRSTKMHKVLKRCRRASRNLS